MSMSEEEEDETHSVEAILDQRFTADSTMEYLIKWEGYPESESTWVEAANIVEGLENLLQDYEEREASAKRRRSTRLRQRGGSGAVKRQRNNSGAVSKPRKDTPAPPKRTQRRRPAVKESLPIVEEEEEEEEEQEQRSTRTGATKRRKSSTRQQAPKKQRSKPDTAPVKMVEVESNPLPAIAEDKSEDVSHEELRAQSAGFVAPSASLSRRGNSRRDQSRKAKATASSSPATTSSSSPSTSSSSSRPPLLTPSASSAQHTTVTPAAQQGKEADITGEDGTQPWWDLFFLRVAALLDITWLSLLGFLVIAIHKNAGARKLAQSWIEGTCTGYFSESSCTTFSNWVLDKPHDLELLSVAMIFYGAASVVAWWWSTRDSLMTRTQTSAAAAFVSVLVYLLLRRSSVFDQSQDQKESDLFIFTVAAFLLQDLILNRAHRSLITVVHSLLLLIQCLQLYAGASTLSQSHLEIGHFTLAVVMLRELHFALRRGHKGMPVGPLAEQASWAAMIGFAMLRGLFVANSDAVLKVENTKDKLCVLLFMACSTVIILIDGLLESTPN